MNRADLGLPSGSKAATYQQNRDSAKLIFPAGFYAYGKAELRKSYEDLLWENHQLKKENHRLLDQNLEYHRQRAKDLEELGQQKDLIIELYSKINNESEISPLKVAG